MHGWYDVHARGDMRMWRANVHPAFGILCRRMLCSPHTRTHARTHTHTHTCTQNAERDNMKQQMAMEVLAIIMGNPFFAELRTKQQAPILKSSLHSDCESQLPCHAHF